MRKYDNVHYKWSQRKIDKKEMFANNSFSLDFSPRELLYHIIEKIPSLYIWQTYIYLSPYYFSSFYHKIMTIYLLAYLSMSISYLYLSFFYKSINLYTNVPMYLSMIDMYIYICVWLYLYFPSISLSFYTSSLLSSLSVNLFSYNVA